MKRIIHTFVIAFQFIILSAVLTACKEDDGNISSPQEVTPSFFWEGSSFQLEADNGWSITRFANRVALSNFHQKCQYKRYFKDIRSRKETANHPSRRIAHRRHQWNVLQHPFPKRRSNGYIAIL